MKLPSDPNELRKLPRWLRAIAWRLPIEFGELAGKLTYKPFNKCFNKKTLVEYIPDRGEVIEETAVTTGQQEILFRALAYTSENSEDIVEIGSWRGITTAALARRTNKQIYAVDPYITNEFSGINEALEAFNNRVVEFQKVIHVRNSSGDAARQLAETRFSLIFVDAIHDYINTWYDFVVWGNLLVPGGIIIFHDVDDHPGTYFACRRILKQKNYYVWGYCPNLVAFQKISD